MKLLFKKNHSEKMFERPARFVFYYKNISFLTDFIQPFRWGFFLPNCSQPYKL